MTPLRARVTLFAVSALCLATAFNALFLQDRARPNDGPSVAVSITQLAPPARAAAEATPAALTPPNPVDTEARLGASIARELRQKGYEDDLGAAGFNLRAAILVYQYDSGQPLTGEPTQELLKHLIFDLNPAPRGAFADRAEAAQAFVLATQKLLLELGFFSGPLSGRMDMSTAKAIEAFERHRNIRVTGRLSETTLLELVSYTGQPLRWAANQ